MKRVVAAGLISTMLIGGLAGCSLNQDIQVNKVDGTTQSSKKVTNEDKKDNNESDANKIDYDKYSLMGEIFRFEGENVEILSGDIMESYKLSKDIQKKFYIGETIGIYEEDGQTKVDRLLHDDYKIIHNSMGEMIKVVMGTVESINEDNIQVKTEVGMLKIDVFAAQGAEVGDSVTLEYVERGENKVAVNLYRENSTMNLIINNISRGENGIMILETISNDDKKGEATVYVNNTTRVNFNLSELKKDDKIVLYPGIVMTSYPPQIDALKIIK